MATAWVREYSDTGASLERDATLGGGGRAAHAPIAKEPGVADQIVTFTTSTQSTAFNASTGYICFILSAAGHYLVGDNPTATTSNLKVPADVLHWVGVKPGQKIAFIAAA